MSQVEAVRCRRGMKALSMMVAVLCACSPAMSSSGDGGGRATGGGSGGGSVAGGGSAVAGGAGGTSAGGGAASCPVFNLVTFDVSRNGRALSPFVPDAGFAIDEDVTLTGVTTPTPGVQALDFEHADAGWRIVLGAPGTPISVQPGETLGLHLSQATVWTFVPAYERRLVLRRGSTVIAFAAAAEQKSDLPAVPNFSAIGLSMQTGAVWCEEPTRAGVPCGRRLTSLQIDAGGTTATLKPGETAALGPYDVTVDSLEASVDTGFCDSGGFTQLVGLRAR